MFAFAISISQNFRPEKSYANQSSQIFINTLRKWNTKLHFFQIPIDYH